MAEAKKKKKKQGASAKREERRFAPELGSKSKTIYAGAGLAAALLGAGVYGQFRTAFDSAADGPMKNASYILGAGALALAAVVLIFPEAPKPILVGDVGVGVELGDETKRVFWCDVAEVRLLNGAIVVKSDDLTITASLEEHAQAAAHIYAEAKARVPDVVEISEADAKSIPSVDRAAGEARPIPDLQIAGRHCADSEKPITFAPDARLCPRCFECYHKEHVPETCVTCGGSMAEPIEGTA
jgi:hypothetical protein